METAGDEEGGMMMMRRRKKAEIDTSAPFGSVQEAVLLFGQRANQVYACTNVKELHDGTSEDTHKDNSRLGSIAIELEETKQSLQKAREESMVMASCLSSLQEELRRTKRELQQLKGSRESEKQVMQELEIDEDIKFVEDIYSKEEEFQVKMTPTFQLEQNVEFQKKRYVTFADPPSLAQVVVPPPTPSDHAAVLLRHPSLRKSKKKPLLPLIKGFFRKRGSSGVGPVDA
ncbi:hypothetical protein ACH5RR_035234 [Cinchona calisaya]|uniref:WEB family protein n=1 Tax=Cinchona calisaya TaxID=153742 RepID=A0ABD2YD89_9GENT